MTALVRDLYCVFSSVQGLKADPVHSTQSANPETQKKINDISPDKVISCAWVKTALVLELWDCM